MTTTQTAGRERERDYLVEQLRRAAAFNDECADLVARSPKGFPEILADRLESQRAARAEITRLNARLREIGF